jgi:ribosomal-protein-alanine N-acetyltransferase
MMSAVSSDSDAVRPGDDGLLRGERILLRLLRMEDEDAFVGAVASSRHLHQPWVTASADAAGFRELVERNRGADFRTLVGWRRDDGTIAGVVNVSQIVRRNFQSAFAGFWASSASAGRGLMRETLALALEHVFVAEGLHRIEANVQPGNERSLALVRRMGFVHEGFSRRYLLIDGEWRDHERFALTVEDWRQNRPPSA